MNPSHHARIETPRQFLETLKAGPYAWPGGYPVYFIASDGEALSYSAARENARLIAEAIRDHDGGGWRVIACEVNWEDPELYCAHSNKRIESAYAEDAVSA